MKKKVKDACAYAQRLKCGWSEQRDLNPHGCPRDSKSRMSANFIMFRKMVPGKGFEPLTYRLEICYSIQLRYPGILLS